MGGFRRIGDPNENFLADPDIDIYLSYTWDIKTIFSKETANEQYLIYLKDANTPTFTANKETYVGVNLEYKYAKSVTWEDIKLTWYDTGMLHTIKSWRESVWSSRYGLQPAASYKAETVLRCFLPEDKNSRAELEGYFGWKLHGSWPSSIRSGDLTYTSSDAKIVEVTVTYDWAEEFVGKKP